MTCGVGAAFIPRDCFHRCSAAPQTPDNVIPGASGGNSRQTAIPGAPGLTGHTVP